MHHSQYFFTPTGVFPYTCALFGRPFPVFPMVCMALPHTPLPRKQMSPAPHVTALKTAGFGRTGVERAQLPNIISIASNKTRELRAKNLRLFDKTRGLSKSGGEWIDEMIDFQKEYWIIRIQITIKTYSTLNICILSGYSNSKDRIISTYFIAFQWIAENIK